MFQNWLYFFGFTGALYLTKSIFSLLKVTLRILVPRTELQKYLEDGAYAVITGASEGIGREYAVQLAKKGFNLVILSRSKEKLNLVAEEAEAHGVKVIVCPFDFGSQDDYSPIREIINNLKVTILVNNVAVCHDLPVEFAAETESKIEQILQVNINSVLKLTKMLLVPMIAQKKGLIINMGSFSGIAPAPYLSVYGASKAFLKAWSVALSHEVADKGIHVELENTMYVATSMSKIKKSSAFAPAPKTYVESVLKRTGKHYYHTPYWAHSLITWIVCNFVEETLITKLMAAELAKIQRRVTKISPAASQ